jgi:predicted dehydrogenase
VTFRPIPDDGRPLSLVVVGAGAMGRNWLAAVLASDEVRLTALADLDVGLAHRVATELGLAGLPVGPDAAELAATTGAQAVVDVTVPAAHHLVTGSALFAGLPVLGEKPAAATLAEAMSLAAASDVTGELFMVSQSRRWNPRLFALRDLARRLGPVGVLAVQLFKAPRFGGFRDEMDDPLLVDMAIHAFDAARFVLADEPVAVYADAHNPSWSWYRGAAAATAVFAMDSGARFTYTGSWCSPGAETSWNGAWRVSGERGTALWDGEHDPDLDPAPDAPAQHTPRREGIAWALSEFVRALRTGVRPMGEVHENLLSLAMVEAAVLSTGTARRVMIDDVLDAALAEAIAAETREDVRAALRTWTSVRSRLSAAGIRP